MVPEAPLIEAARPMMGVAKLRIANRAPHKCAIEGCAPVLVAHVRALR